MCVSQSLAGLLEMWCNAGRITVGVLGVAFSPSKLDSILRMDRPIPFITLTEDSLKQKKEGKDDPKRKFVLHDEACRIIEGIKQPKIAVRLTLQPSILLLLLLLLLLLDSKGRR